MSKKDIFVYVSTGYNLDDPSKHCEYQWLKQTWKDNEVSFTAVSKIADADIVIFPGGSDISPALYNERKNTRTYVNTTMDEIHVSDFKYAVKHNKFIIGICRGAQLSCVMAGGKLIQHIENHGKYTSTAGHYIYSTDTGFSYLVNSIHHQMMQPYDLNKEDYTLLAYSLKGEKTRYYDQHDQPYKIGDIILNEYSAFAEPEIVYFKNINAIAIQSHPEIMYKNDTFSKATTYISNLIRLCYMRYDAKLQESNPSSNLKVVRYNE